MEDPFILSDDIYTTEEENLANKKKRLGAAAGAVYNYIQSGREEFPAEEAEILFGALGSENLEIVRLANMFISGLFSAIQRRQNIDELHQHGIYHFEEEKQERPITKKELYGFLGNMFEIMCENVKNQEVDTKNSLARDTFLLCIDSLCVYANQYRDPRVLETIQRQIDALEEQKEAKEILQLKKLNIQTNGANRALERTNLSECCILV